jgi:hypothetical protein
MSLAKKLLSVQPAAGGGAFNPETDVTWHSLFWAEGTDMTALAYADAASVTTWPNETGGTDGTGTSATYSASAINGQPAVSFATGSSVNWGNQTVAQPYTVVAIVRNDEATVTQDRSVASFGVGPDMKLWIDFSKGWGLYGGAVQYSLAYDTNPALVVGHLDGASSFLAVDGTNIVTANLGTKDASNSPANIGENWDGDIAFVGIYEGGDITADASWPDFETWVSDHYGITIA